MKSIPQIINKSTHTNHPPTEHSGRSNHAIASAVFAAFGLMPMAADAIQEPQPTGWPLLGQAEFNYVNLTGSGHVGEFPNAAAGAIPSNWGTGNVDPISGAVVPGSWLASHAKLVSMLDSLPTSPDVLLIGDSITQQWGNPLNEGTTFPTEINSSWQKYFPNYNAVSIGIGGDTTSGVLWRLNHGGLTGTNTARAIAPKAVVLLIGTNNIGGATNTDIAKGVRTCVENIRQYLPNTRILVVGVLPRYDVASVGAQVAPLNLEINKALRDLTETPDPMVGLLDIGANFYNADGTIKAEAFRDKLHLTDANTVPYGVESGYDIYARSIQAKLDSLILQANKGNHYPSIGAVADQAISPDTSTAEILFSVGDSETAAGGLKVIATSSNTALVPNTNIVLGGSGANRTIKITPAAKTVGTASITIQVTDAAGLTSKKTFTVNVGPLQPALVICDDGFKNGWFEAGTAGNTANATPVHTGATSTAVGFSSGSTIYNLFNNQGGSDVSTYQSLSFWIHGGASGGQKVKLYLRQSADNSGLKAVNVMLSLPPFPRNSWGKYTVPLAAFKAAGGIKLQSFMFQSDGERSPFFIDDVVLDPNNPASSGTASTSSGAPVLITQPISSVATVGTSVTLSVGATATPAPTYQWQSAPKGSAAFANIPNATTASLNTGTLATSDNGKQFRCIVRNERGTVTSSVATITVNALPSVGFAIANQRVMESSATASIAVQLSAPSSRDVAIPFSLSGTAKASTDYTVTQSPLIIPAGATSAEIRVNLVNDSTYQYWDRSVVVTLGTPNNALKGSSSVHTLNIGDDDAIPGVEPQPDGWPLTAEEQKYVTTLPYSIRWPNAVDSRATASVADWWGKDGAPSDAYLSKHTQLVETVQRNQGPIDVLLVGDSITQQWGGWFPPTPDDGVTFTKDATWPKEFPQLKTVNIGIGGDKTFGVQWRLRHGGVDGLAPRMVVLAIGTNNLQMGQSLESIAQGVMECVNQLRRKLPSSQILVMGVLPRNDDPNAGALVAPFNEILRKKILNSDGTKLDAQVNWMDIGSLMKDANGNLKANVFRDGIHLTQDVGYKIYADALRPVFNNLIPATGNRPPTITPIASQLIAPNSVSQPIPFSIGDSSSSSDSLSITATSSNPDVVPVSGIKITGSGSNRLLTITPASNKKGTSTIRLSVSDGSLASTCIFDVNVATFTPLSGYVVYQDSIQSSWNAAPSWGVKWDPSSSNEPYNGLRSLSVIPIGSGGALSLYQTSPVPIASYKSASFAIHGGTSGGQKLEFALIYTTGDTVTQQTFPLTLTGNAWEKYTFPLNPPSGNSNTRLQNIRFRDLSTGKTATYYVDDITLDLRNEAATPVVISGQPSNAIVSAGASASFEVKASGNPTPTFQWQSAPKGSSAFTNIAGATASSYTTSPATVADDGRQFRCVVTNSVASVTSGVSTLSVNAAPVITTQAANTTVVAGTPTTFTIAASGNPEPTYQWQSAPKGSNAFANIAGATAASYTTTATTLADDGRQFRCLVTNSVASVTSGVSTLNVNAAPVITTQAANTTVVAGTPATFTIAASGNPAPTYQWQSAPKGSSAFANITGATAASYTTTATTLADDGRQFRCLVTNSVASVTSGVSTLSVNAAPVVTTQAANTTVVAGTPATFTIEASGNPAPTYQWQSAPKGNSAFANIAGATAASYTTTATTLADNGRQFRCVVTNSVASVISVIGTIALNSAPVITTQPVSQPVPRGEFTRFRVVASGSPTPSYQWQWAPKGSLAFANIANGTSNTWGTARVDDANNGRQYRCVITNSVGSVTSDIVTLTMIREAQPSVGFVTATQSLLEGPEPVSHPPVLNYPYESYPKAPELALQPAGWPLTEEERTYVLKSEGLRFPGVESNKHLPQLWPVTPMAACWGQTGDTRWLDNHTKLVNTVQANKGAIDLLLIGDSLTEYWGGGYNGAPFNAAWKNHFAQYKTVNIGIGGDKTQNILWRLKHGALDGAAPKVVVLLIGTNNINSTVYNGTPVEAVAQGIKLCVDGIRAKCPNSEIVLVRPFPMGPAGTATFVNGQKINTAVEGLTFENDPKVHILDFYRDFFNSDGSIKAECFDSPQSILHLDPVKGYNLYADRLKPVVEQLMAKIAATEAAPKTTTLKVSVKLSSAATQDITVPFNVSGTAIKGVDYTISASPLKIPAGATSTEITVMVNDDVAAEIGKETIVITLESPNGGTLGTDSVHTIIINDNNLPDPLKTN